METRPGDVRVVIMAEEQAKDMSVRHSLRCIGRDCRSLWRALQGHGRRYIGAFSQGWDYHARWWTRR